MTVTIYFPDLPEFSVLVQRAGAAPDCAVVRQSNGYVRIQAPSRLRFVRKELGLGPALWNSALSGGFRGRIETYDRNEMVLLSDEATIE